MAKKSDSIKVAEASKVARLTSGVIGAVTGVSAGVVTDLILTSLLPVPKTPITKIGIGLGACGVSSYVGTRIADATTEDTKQFVGSLLMIKHDLCEELNKATNPTEG